LLPQIYYLGFLLPEKWTDDIRNTRSRDKENGLIFKRSRELFEELRIYLGKDDEYEQVFDPVSDNSVTEHSVADDLTDIYSNLKQSLVLYETGGELERRAAVWDWKFTMQTHAGKHIVDALWAIHHILFSPR
jgi:hypothetical protein